MKPSYEDTSVLTGPNDEVLEAQGRVCTGPTQSRPLGRRPGDPDPDRILTLVLASLRGELPPERTASRAQIGAFTAAMTIRTTFPDRTAWSEAESAAFAKHGRALEAADPAVRFLLSADTAHAPPHPVDRALADHLQHVLRGRHLTYGDTRAALEAVTAPDGDPALKAALLIGQRMNIESDDEFRAYLDSVVEPSDVRPVDVDTLTTIGEPYNGSTRFFKPTCFVAAVRAALGRATLLHGVDVAPPKNGVTEEQILAALGADTTLSVERAAALIERPDVGFAYVSQREFAPHVYGILDLRAHIGKRPTWSASEKAQSLLRARDRNDAVVGYFHPGYEAKQLAAMRDRGFDAGFVIKGEEGTSQIGLRSGAPSDGDRKTLNHVEGYRGATEIARDLDPSVLGFTYDVSPRLEPVTAESFAAAGRHALDGADTHIADRIVLNAGVLDWLLGYASDPHDAIAEARRVVADGAVRSRLDAYVAASRGD